MNAAGWLRLYWAFLKSWPRLPARHLAYLAHQLRFEHPHRCGGRVWVNSFFPPLPSPAFDRFLGGVAARRRVPFSTYVAVTGRCPGRCAHCSYARHAAAEPDTTQLLDTIRQAKALGAALVGLTGGEPLLRADLPELVAAIGPEAESILFTTGHGLDEALARKLADARLGCLTVGLEAADPAVHDVARGVAGSFEEAGRAVRLGLAAGFYTALSTVATRARLRDGELPRLAALGAAWGVHELRILQPVATGGLWGRAEEMLDPIETAAVAGFHKAWNRARRGPAVAATAHLESPPMFGCGAGYHHLFIDAGGNVAPCDLTPLAFGNVRDEPLADIWERLGRWFDRPRRDCLMRSLAPALGRLPDPAELPLPPGTSAGLPLNHPAGEALPGIYRHLLRDRK